MPQKKKAVALKYNLEQDLAPVVIASGYGEVAEKIINIAEERGIPVYRDDSAASMLCMLEVGASIPEELYEVVATIYVQIMETANRIKAGVLGQAASTSGLAGSRSGGRILTPLDVPMEAGMRPEAAGEPRAYGGASDGSGDGYDRYDDNGDGGGFGGNVGNGNDEGYNGDSDDDGYEGDDFVETYPRRETETPEPAQGEGGSPV